MLLYYVTSTPLILLNDTSEITFLAKMHFKINLWSTGLHLSWSACGLQDLHYILCNSFLYKQISYRTLSPKGSSCSAAHCPNRSASTAFPSSPGMELITPKTQTGGKYCAFVWLRMPKYSMPPTFHTQTQKMYVGPLVISDSTNVTVFPLWTLRPLVTFTTRLN